MKKVIGLFTASFLVFYGLLYALDFGDGGGGATAPTSPATVTTLTVNEDATVGTGEAEDNQINFNGNAQDFHIGLDDSVDDLVIGVGSALGTTQAIGVNENADVTITNELTVSGTGSHTFGGPLRLYSRTAAQLGALAPGAALEQIGCSDCTVSLVCISSGTGAGAWVEVADKTAACDD